MKKNIFLFITVISMLLVNNIHAQEKFTKTLKINGRIQYDYEFLKREKVNDWFNGNEFRRAQISATGKVSPHFKYKVELSFAHGSLGFRDVYIKYLGGKLGNFSIGSVPEPTGLEVLTSSKYIPFFERSMISSLQNFKWGSGLHYENFGLLDGKASIQMSLTNNGVNAEGFKDATLEKGSNFVVRLAATPIVDDNNFIHLGINYASRPEKDHIKFRPENHMGNKYNYIFPGATGRVETGFEFATVYNSFSLQAEYKTEKIDNNINKDYKINGYYVMGSFFVTGEHRPYKHAAFGRVKPLKDIANGGYGALEFLFRYSNMNPSEDITSINIGSPKEINNISFGINWYLNAHTRIMYNYVLTDDQNSLLGNLYGHLIRFQIDF